MTPSLWDSLGKTLANLPRFLLEYFGGLVVAIFSNYDIFTMFLAAVCAGVLAGILGLATLKAVFIGLLVFFVSYGASRVLTAHSMNMAHAARMTRVQEPQVPPM
jgi:hypothetical protein